MKIAIHTLTPVQPGNFNRDDLGMNKVVTVGGTVRVRHSSQSIKAAVRRYLSDAASAVPLTGVRTAEVIDLIADSMASAGHAISDADKAVVSTNISKVFDSKAKSSRIEEADRLEGDIPDLEEKAQAAEKALKDAENSAKNGAKPDKELVEAAKKARNKVKSTQGKLDDLRDKIANSKALIFISRAAAAALGEEALAATNPLTPGQVSDQLNSSITLDIAAFGRMFAATGGFDVDAAVEVAHAFSIDQCAFDTDFFTAMDDLTGTAGVMDTLYLAAPIMYRYAMIDTDALAANLGESTADEAFKAKVRALINAFIMASPDGRKNGSGKQALPSTVLVTTGDTASILANGFTRALTSEIEGTDKLVDTADRIRTAYGFETRGYFWSMTEAALPEWVVEHDTIHKLLNSAV